MNPVDLARGDARGGITAEDFPSILAADPLFGQNAPLDPGGSLS
jgi:hypothetical protein